MTNKPTINEYEKIISGLKKENEELEKELEITIKYFKKNYIRNGVPERVYKELEKENEELKKEVYNLTERNYEYSRTIDRWGHAHGEMYYENKALKEELEKIREYDSE